MQETTYSEESINHSISRPKALSLEKGFFHSCTVRISPGRVFSLCTDEEIMDKVLRTLPEFIYKRIHLDQITRDVDEKNLKISWTNKYESSLQFKANLYLSQAPADRGTYISAEAFFEVPKSKMLSDILEIDNPEPSMLVSILLRRLKALLETGEIATTKGQPNGNDEIESHKNLH